MLVEISKKLGISSKKTFQKAEELLRLWEIKATTLRHINSCLKTIICLDLAAQKSGQSINQEAAIKLSGTKKSVYVATYQMAEKFLGIEEEISIRGLCSLLGCSQVSSSAQSLLSHFEQQVCENQGLSKEQLAHPSYLAACVSAVTKIQKVSIDRTKLRGISRLKKSSFDELVKQFVTLHTAQNPKEPKTSKREKTLIESIEEQLCAQASEAENNKCKDVSEDYEEWKRKILLQANLL